MGNYDYYECLGVARDASHEQIKRAYRKMVRKSHPDLNPEDPSAPERLKQVITAYHTLSDPTQRARYDRIEDLFGPYRRSRREVVMEKAAHCEPVGHCARAYPKSVLSRKAEARKPALLSILLVCIITLVMFLGIASEGFSRNPFRWVPVWRAGEGVLRTGDADNDPVEMNSAGRWDLYEWAS